MASAYLHKGIRGQCYCTRLEVREGTVRQVRATSQDREHPKKGPSSCKRAESQAPTSRNSSSLSVILRRMVRAPYSRLSLATQQGTMLCASTSWQATGCTASAICRPPPTKAFSEPKYLIKPMHARLAKILPGASTYRAALPLRSAEVRGQQLPKLRTFTGYRPGRGTRYRHSLRRRAASQALCQHSLQGRSSSNGAPPKSQDTPTISRPGQREPRAFHDALYFQRHPWCTV